MADNNNSDIRLKYYMYNGDWHNNNKLLAPRDAIKNVSETDVRRRYDQMRFSRVIFPLRWLGMFTSAIAILSVFMERGTTAIGWIFIVFIVFIWPWLAFVRCKFSKRPRRSEVKNIMWDSVWAAISVCLMEFCLLPSFMIFSCAIVNSAVTGIKNLWPKVMLVAFASLGLAILFIQPSINVETSTRVVVACIPLLLGYNWIFAWVSVRFMNQVARKHKELYELNRIDSLTGLLSRDHWVDFAQKLFLDIKDQKYKACLLMIDIDLFKQINDTYGHVAGDDAICAVASVLRDCLRSEDKAGRYGGDEFCVILPNTSTDDALKIAKRICDRVSKLNLRTTPDFNFSLSIGIATFHNFLEDLREWIMQADNALYQAKKSGRNGVVICCFCDDLDCIVTKSYETF